MSTNIRYERNAMMSAATLTADDGGSCYVFCSLPGGRPWFSLSRDGLATEIVNAPQCDTHADFKTVCRRTFRLRGSEQDPAGYRLGHTRSNPAPLPNRQEPDMSTIPTNTDDVIDSRDVIHAIEDLIALRTDDPESFTEDDAETLTSLEALAADAADYASDWHYGESLIRDSYFETYAQELADDLGAVDRDAKWPMTCIDWAWAARELQQDYTAITWDGVTYWTR